MKKFLFEWNYGTNYFINNEYETHLNEMDSLESLKTLVQYISKEEKFFSDYRKKSLLFVVLFLALYQLVMILSLFFLILLFHEDVLIVLGFCLFFDFFKLH
jgi:uncharacterized membrane protein